MIPDIIVDIMMTLVYLPILDYIIVHGLHKTYTAIKNKKI